MKLEFKVLDKKYFNIKDVLKNHFEISERLLAKLKRNQKIFLNAEPTYVSSEISIGDLITVDLDFEEDNENIIPTEIHLEILFEDDCFLIVNKPFGIPVHPSILHFGDSLSNGIKYYYNSIGLNKKIRPINRLDKDTSGIVVFAKNEYVQEALIRQMKNNTFQKEYIAILTGFLEKESGIIDAAISRKEGSIIEREINLNGENAITHFKLIKHFTKNNQNLSLLNFKLETGRTHQIRLHSKYLSHPILGDSLYGKTSDLISRQALHAYKIQFIHPISKKELCFEIDLPNDMKEVINS